MANYSKEELQYIASQVQPYLLELVKSLGLDVDGIEVVEEYEGISSLPAYDSRGGTRKLVRVPLSAFAKPAADAVAEIEELISVAEETIERSEEALTNTKATLDEIYGIRDEIVKALGQAQESIENLETRIVEVETSEAQRVKNENTRVINENNRVSAEVVRDNSEDVRINNENTRKNTEASRESSENERVKAETTRISNENTRIDNENKRIASENTRVAAEKDRENVKAEMVSLNTELKNHPPRINSEMNWEIWDAVNKVYVDTGITAHGKSPVIIDGIWWLWDDDADAYVSSGWSVNTDFELTKGGIEGVLGGSPMVYIEEWKHTDVPYKSGMQVRFNQEFYIALRETSVAPIPLFEIEEGVYAKVSETEYATVGCYEADGNKEDWKKIPYDELRLVSREGTLNGEEVNIDDLSGEEVYQFVPNLYIDFKKGTINGIKASELIGRIKRIEEKLGL